MSSARAALVPHPATPCAVVGAAEIHAERAADGEIRLRWTLSGVTDGLVWPARGEGRTDFLWRRTCFEAFIQAPPDLGYRELNHGHGAWAAYRFTSFRSGMGDAPLGPPRIRIEIGAAEGLIEAVWRLDLPADAAWRLGATMVIEAADGSLSYWAVTHPGARPEFHDAAGWTLDLTAP